MVIKQIITANFIIKIFLWLMAMVALAKDYGHAVEQ